MAGLYTNFVIYEEQFYSGMFETLEQYSNAFNEASRNAIRIIPQAARGNFLQEAFFTNIPGLYKRRNIETLDPSVPDALSSAETVFPKVNRYFHVENTMDSLKKIQASPEQFSFILGQQAGKAKAVDYLNTGIAAAVACISGVSALVTTSNATANYDTLIESLEKFGDAADRILLWVMPSRPFFALMKASLDVVTDRVAGATIYEGQIGSLARRVLLTDSPSLVVPGEPNQYYILGLTENAIALIESEPGELLSERVGGYQNIRYRIQGEDAYNVGIKGYAYTGSVVNPDDAAIASSSNWVLRSSDVKSSAGILTSVL